MIKKLIIIFFVAILAQMLWFSEIYFLDEWYSLYWLHHPVYAAYIGTLIAAALPIYLLKHTKKQLIIYTFLLWCINLLLFNYGKILCYGTFGRFSNLLPGGAYGFLLACFFGYVVQTLGYRFVATKLGYVFSLGRLMAWTVLGMLCLPLSTLSILLFGSPGNQISIIDSIKMGYPVFWSIFILSTLVLFLKPKEPLLQQAQHHEN